MIENYYKLVIAGKRTCNPDNKTVRQVHYTCFDAVLEMLVANGRDADGKKIA